MPKTRKMNRYKKKRVGGDKSVSDVQSAASAAVKNVAGAVKDMTGQVKDMTGQVKDMTGQVKDMTGQVEEKVEKKVVEERGAEAAKETPITPPKPSLFERVKSWWPFSTKQTGGKKRKTKKGRTSKRTKKRGRRKRKTRR